MSSGVTQLAQSHPQTMYDSTRVCSFSSSLLAHEISKDNDTIAIVVFTDRLGLGWLVMELMMSKNTKVRYLF